MDIHILGLNHQIQSTRIGSSSTGGELERFERGQKEQFDILLQKKIDEFAVEFVGEEARHGWDSIPAQANATVCSPTRSPIKGESCSRIRRRFNPLD